MPKKRKRPKNTPRRVRIGGEWYVLSVFRVQERYEDGTPEDMTLIKEDGVAELSTDPSKNQFITGFIREEEYGNPNYAENSSGA